MAASRLPDSLEKPGPEKGRRGGALNDDDSAIRSEHSRRVVPELRGHREWRWKCENQAIERRGGEGQSSRVSANHPPRSPPAGEHPLGTPLHAWRSIQPICLESQIQKVIEKSAWPTADVENASPDQIPDRDALPLSPPSTGHQPAYRVIGPRDLVVEALEAP